MGTKITKASLYINWCAAWRAEALYVVAGGAYLHRGVVRNPAENHGKRSVQRQELHTPRVQSCRQICSAKSTTGKAERVRAAVGWGDRVSLRHLAPATVDPLDSYPLPSADDCISGGKRCLEEPPSHRPSLVFLRLREPARGEEKLKHENFVGRGTDRIFTHY